MKYDRDISPHPHLFYGTNSHEAAKVVHTEKMGIKNKKRVKNSVINIAKRLSVVVG